MESSTYSTVSVPKSKYSGKVVICAGIESGRFAYGLFAYDYSRFAYVLYVSSPTIHMLKL